MLVFSCFVGKKCGKTFSYPPLLFYVKKEAIQYASKQQEVFYAILQSSADAVLVVLCSYDRGLKDEKR